MEADRGTEPRSNAARNRKKNGRNSTPTTNLICEVAKTLGTYTMKQLREFGYSEAQVWTANDTLLRRKLIRKIGRGQYEYLPEAASKKEEAPLADRIWHAMRINPVFSCGDIALQAGTSLTYVWLRLREYAAEGLVKASGKRGRERLWRITGKGRDCIERPDVEIFEPDRAVVLAARINRLVATGLAKKFPKENLAACEACGELLSILCSRADGQ
jgi:hypothetical protein